MTKKKQALPKTIYVSKRTGSSKLETWFEACEDYRELANDEEDRTVGVYALQKLARLTTEVKTNLISED